MGLKYIIESYDVTRVALPALIRDWPELLGEVEGEFQFGDAAARAVLSLSIEGNKVLVRQHVLSQESDAILARVVRQILAWNDHVVLSKS